MIFAFLFFSIFLIFYFLFFWRYLHFLFCAACSCVWARIPPREMEITRSNRSNRRNGGENEPKGNKNKNGYPMFSELPDFPRSCAESGSRYRASVARLDFPVFRFSSRTTERGQRQTSTEAARLESNRGETKWNESQRNDTKRNSWYRSPKAPQCNNNSWRGRRAEESTPRCAKSQALKSPTNAMLVIWPLTAIS